MGDSNSSSRELEESARKREAIGLAPRRPTARANVQSPPEARGSRPLGLAAIVVLAVIALVLILWRESIFKSVPFVGQTMLAPEEGRLVARDDFADPHFSLPVRSDGKSDQRYVGNLYQIRILQPGSLTWAPLSQPNLGAYRLEADLRLATQGELAWGYGGLIVRFQNEESFYLFAIDGRGEYQVQLKEEGSWRTVQPWTLSAALSSGSQNVLSVVDDGAELRLYINAIQVFTVSNPRLPVGDVGLAVGARSQGLAQGLFDWVALYEIPIAK